MNLEKYTLNFSQQIILNAREELYKYEQEKSEMKCIWGYFPDLPGNNPELYPKCVVLKKHLDAYLRSRLGNENQLTMSFLKLASRKAEIEFGGLHLDDRPAPADEPDTTSRILRLIINLGDFPRRLNYSKPVKERELFNHNKNIPTEMIDIPERNNNLVWALKFWSSEVPHVGVTDEHGYFIAAYGGYFDESKLK